MRPSDSAVLLSVPDVSASGTTVAAAMPKGVSEAFTALAVLLILKKSHKLTSNVNI